MRRGFILLFCACWVVSVASLGLRAGHPFAQPQATAPGWQSGVAVGQGQVPGGQATAP